MRLLITGISGLVGTYLSLSVNHQCDVFGTYRENEPVFKKRCEPQKLNLGNRKEVFKYIESVRPDAIIHAAGSRDINYCEENPGFAFESHVISTRNLVDAIGRSSTTFVYISTDCVFPGRKPFYTEGDDASPINQYGKAKLMAENYVCEKVPDHLIVRVSLVFGWTFGRQASNTVQDVVRSLREQKPLVLSRAMYNTPLYAVDACRLIVQMIDADGIRGIVHLSGNTRVSRYELGVKAAQDFSLDDRLVVPTDELLPNRPRNSCLAMNRICGIYDLSCCDVQAGLVSMRKDEKLFGDGYAENIS
jgi:dTDP-4-dehydrorhamnose reductase